VRKLKKTITVLCCILILNIILFGNQLETSKSDIKEQLVLPVENFFFCISENGDAENWPMFGHDPAHTKYSTSTGPETNETLFQQSMDGALFWVESNGVSVFNWKAYLGLGNNLYCINPYSGETIFHQTFPSVISTVPTIDAEKVYFGSIDFKLYAVNASTGLIIWTYDTGNIILDSSPTLYDNKIYIGGFNNKMMCIDTDGDEVWNYSVGDLIEPSPAVVNDKVYFGSQDGNVYCLNANNGSHIWNTEADGHPRYAPVVVNNKVYIGIEGKKVLCLNAINGSVNWNFSDVVPGPVAVHDGKVYFGSSSNYKLYCLDAESGEELWTSGATYRSNCIIADGKLYYGYESKIICLNANNGSEIWRYSSTDFNDNFYSTLSIYDGIVYAISQHPLEDESTLYAFGSNEPPEIPDQPDGPTEGYVGVEYTYTTDMVSDPDEDDVLYKFDWGDGTDSGWISSLSTTHAWDETGIYNVKVKAKDDLGAESEWSQPLTIQIISEEQPVEIGWIYGSVLDKSTKNPIENVNITISSTETTDYTSTDEEGNYNILVQNGTYLVIASKNGYVTSTKQNITVDISQATQVNFELEKSDEDSITGENRDRINEAIEAGKIGGEITFKRKENEIEYEETIYANITITPRDIDAENKKISVAVDGEEENGKTIVITINKNVFTLIDVIVEYDGINAREADGFLDIIDSSDDGSLPEYYVIYEQNEVFVLVSLPHFSEHTITVYSLVEAIGDVTSVALYVMICIIAGIVFLSRVFTHPVYQNYFRKKKSK